MGVDGLENAALQCTSKAHYLAEQLGKPGFPLERDKEFFHEFVTRSDTPSQKVLDALEKEDILGGYPLDEHRILWCCTEMNTKQEMDRLVQIVKEV